MQLLRELLIESKLEVTSADDLWSEGESKDYRDRSEYLVKKEDGKYVAFKIQGDTKKEFGVFTKSELSDILSPLRANQTPDVEGFVKYVSSETVQAFKYKGDPVMVDLPPKKKLKSGDYLVRSTKGDEFVFSVEKSASFEEQMIEV